MKGVVNPHNEVCSSSKYGWGEHRLINLDGDTIYAKLKLAYIHEEGCGKTAFYLHAMPKICEQLYADNVELLNGNSPEKSSLIQCGTCGLLIEGLSVDQIQEVEVNE